MEPELRTLLIEAVRYGDLPETRARLNQVIDASVGDGLTQLLAERALATMGNAAADVKAVRAQMEEARARRLQPHYIRAFFAEAFRSQGGRMIERESGRFEITHTPSVLRDRDRLIGAGAPVLRSYERGTFERHLMRRPGEVTADLLAPARPLMDAVLDLTIEQLRPAVKHGAVLIEATPGADTRTSPRLLVAVRSDVVDGRTPPRTLSRRFEYVEIDENGAATPGGPAPHLEYDVPDPDDAGQQAAARAALAEGWLTRSPHELALAWAVEHGNLEHLHEVTARVAAEAARTRRQVVAAGRGHALLPQIEGAALVLPTGFVARVADTPPVAEDPALHARETARVERRAVDAVLAAERALGREPQEMAHNNPGFDVMSFAPDGQVLVIEVKGRIAGAREVLVTRNEVLTAKNKGTDHVLTLVSVSPGDASQDELRYVVDAFAEHPDPAFDVTKVVLVRAKLWARGEVPG